MLLAYLQPLVVNALVFDNNSHLKSPITQSNISKTQPIEKALSVEAIFVDLDDEDDFSESETKNVNTDIYCQCSFIDAYLKVHSTLATLNSTDFQLKHSSKPLYILWSVFRI